MLIPVWKFGKCSLSSSAWHFMIEQTQRIFEGKQMLSRRTPVVLCQHSNAEQSPDLALVAIKQ